MSDLISRSALIEKIKERTEMHSKDYQAFKNYSGDRKIKDIAKWDECEVIIDIAKTLPAVEAKPKWIPVTELDLDHNQEALIKLDDGFVCSARFLISDSGNNCGFYHKHIGFLQCPQVVAWMPYNAERGGKNE